MADPPDPLLSSNWSRFAPGQMLSGRFRIDSLLGEGGMGEVYRATDLALDNNQVALKTLRSDYASIPEMAQAFRGEVLKAQAVTHRNVCRIHQLEEDTADADDPLLYFTMELIPGQTLAKLLRQGPVAEPLASSILRQVAEGLAAAHSAEPRAVIHCDLKPANVMVELRGEADCRAVITDFGLARMEQTTAEDGTRFSTVLSGAGTRLYLAPEQVLGKPASEASDIYAFGLIAYEVLTGQSPHADLSADGQVTSRALKAPPPPSTLCPGLPPHWDALVTRCLEPDPNRRWRSMAEVVDAIANPVRPWWALPRLTRRQWNIVAGSTISLAGASLLAAAYRYWNQGRANAAPGTLIVMTPVEGLQDPPIEPVLRTALEQSPHFRLWDPARLPGMLKSMTLPPGTAPNAEQWREIAGREAAPFTVFPTLSKSADGFNVHIRIDETGSTPRSSRRTWPKTFEARTAAQLYDAVNDAAHWMREQLGESAQQITSSEVPTQDVTTSSWEAWREFQRGEVLGRSRHTEDEEQAAIAYDAAIRRDDRFALAAFRKGDLLVHVGRSQDAHAAYAAGLEMARQRPLHGMRELEYRFTIASDTGDWLLAEQLAQERMQKYPDQSSGFFHSAWPLLNLGRYEEAIARFHHCERWPSTHRAVRQRLSLAYLAIGDEGKSRAQLALLRGLGGAAWAARSEMVGAYILHRHQRALDLLDPVRKADGSARWQSDCDVAEVNILADGGRTREALDKALGFAAKDAARGLPDRRAVQLTGAAWLSLDLGERDRASELARQSLRSESGMPNRLDCAALLARSGQLPEAEAILASWPTHLPFLNYRLGRMRLEAEIACGRSRARAEDLLRRVQQLDSSACAPPSDSRIARLAGLPDARQFHERALAQKFFQLQGSWPVPAGSWRRENQARTELPPNQHELKG